MKSLKSRESKALFAAVELSRDKVNARIFRSIDSCARSAEYRNLLNDWTNLVNQLKFDGAWPIKDR